MSLFKLPNELILMLGDWADTHTVAALAHTSRLLHGLFNPLLYRRNAKEHNSSALLWAAENGGVDTAKVCLSHGADINAACYLEEESQMRGFLASGTALHYAVRRGQDDFVEYLLDNGADHQRWCTHLCECTAPMGRAVVRQHGADSWTTHWSPLHLALCKGHTSTAKILIDRRVSCEMTCQISWNSGPKAHELCPSGFNVVHEIAVHKNVDVLDYMIDTNYPLGALSNGAAFNGNTPLHYLAIEHSQSSFTILSRLLNSVGPNINAQNNNYMTAFECFVIVEDVQTAQVLFSLGSRPHYKNECVLKAANIHIQESDSVGHESAERRNELVLLLLNHAISAGFLIRDVEKDESSSSTWRRLFYLACKQPALLQRLLDEGFKPPPWDSDHTFLSGMVKYLSRDKAFFGPTLEGLPLLESIRILTRAGERWDERELQESVIKSALKRLEIHNSRDPPTKQLPETRPPEGTGAEQASFDIMCRATLARAEIEKYETLVRYAAENSSSCQQVFFNIYRSIRDRTPSGCLRIKKETSDKQSHLMD